jgi:tetratricopeptide (TPR) repeat protein
MSSAVAAFARGDADACLAACRSRRTALEHALHQMRTPSAAPHDPLAAANRIAQHENELAQTDELCAAALLLKAQPAAALEAANRALAANSQLAAAWNTKGLALSALGRAAEAAAAFQAALDAWGGGGGGCCCFRRASLQLGVGTSKLGQGPRCSQRAGASVG